MTTASDAKSTERPISIAVVPFGLAAGSAPPPYDVAEIIRGDLESAGPIEILPIAELPARPSRLSQVEFETWRSTGADYLVVGLVAEVHDGGHEVEFRLIDPRDESTLVGYLMPSAPDALRDTAHRIADLIEQRIGATSITDAPSPAGSDRRSPDASRDPAPTTAPSARVGHPSSSSLGVRANFPLALEAGGEAARFAIATLRRG